MNIDIDYFEYELYIDMFRYYIFGIIFRIFQKVLLELVVVYDCYFKLIFSIVKSSMLCVKEVVFIFIILVGL